MWSQNTTQIASDNISDSILETQSRQIVEFTLATASVTLKFKIYHKNPLQQYETADAILLVLGRVRRYGEDYPTESNLDWLLKLLLAKPANYYQQLAGKCWINEMAACCC
jgi:hypothetical protein